MSYGTLCLTCRKYVGTGDWCCTCDTPIPSDDGRTPNATPTPLARSVDGLVSNLVWAKQRLPNTPTSELAARYINDAIAELRRLAGAKVQDGGE